MTDISTEARQIIDAGGFDNEGGDLLFLRRFFDDQEQAILEPENGPRGMFRLSQVKHRDYLSKPKQKDFDTLEAALTEADTWQRDVRVGEDPEMRAAWDDHLARRATEA